MSIHTLISSNITDFGALTAILDELGVSWRHETNFYMKATGLPPAHAIEAVIGNEKVWIFQVDEGDSFTFQSQGWRFRNKGAIEALAVAASADQLREQRAATEQQRREAERQAMIAEQRRSEELERRRQQEAERQRVAAEQRRIEEEQQRIAEQQRQAQLADEAAGLLSRLDAERESAAKAPPRKASDPPASSSSPPSADSQQEMERIVGKLHQADALRKIKEHLPDFEDKFGASLEREETLEDETVELRLTL